MIAEESSSTRPQVDFHQLTHLLSRSKRLVMVFALIGLASFAITGVAAKIAYRNTAAIRVRVVFPLGHKGEYSDGSLFRPGDILSENLVKESLEKAGLSNKITPSVLLNRLHAGAVQTLPVKASDKNASLAFTLSLASSQFQDLDVAQRRELLRALSDCFNAQIGRANSNIPFNPDSLGGSLSSMDSVDYVAALESRVKSIEVYIDKLSGRAGVFRSARSGYTFADLFSQCRDIQMSDLEQIKDIACRTLPSDRLDIATAKTKANLLRLENDEKEFLVRQATLYMLLDKADGREALDEAKKKSFSARDVRTFGFPRLISKVLETDYLIESVRIQKIREKNRLNLLAHPSLFASEGSSNQELISAVTALTDHYRLVLGNLQLTKSDFFRQSPIFALAEEIDYLPGADIAMYGLLGAVLGAFMGAALGLTNTSEGGQKLGSARL